MSIIGSRDFPRTLTWGNAYQSKLPEINFFLQYDILKQADIKIPIFIDTFHFQTVNIDGMYSNWGYW